MGLAFSLFQKDEVYLNLVLDYVPETVYRVARHYSRAKQTLPMIFVKVGQIGNGMVVSWMVREFVDVTWFVP